MTTTQIQREEDQEDRELCRHHWVIEAPEGPVSLGSCRTCGETREFKNFIESAPWSEDSREPAPRDAIKVAVPADDDDSDDQ